MDPRDQEIAELKAALAARDAQIAELTQMVLALKEQLGRNSGNSNRPPSSDSPSQRAERRGKSKSERKRGGQPGHAGSTRALLPPGEVDEHFELFPPRCESCWKALPRVPDPSAQRFQTTELPPVKPHLQRSAEPTHLCSRELDHLKITSAMLIPRNWAEPTTGWGQSHSGAGRKRLVGVRGLLPRRGPGG